MRTLRLFCLIANLACSSAYAWNFEGFVSTGLANFRGDLSTTQSTTTQGFGLRSGANPINQNTSFGETTFGIGVDTIFLKAKHDRTYFPYDSDANLSLTSFLLLPTECLALGNRSQICGGMGLGTVNVNSLRNRQDYGTWHYELSAKFQPVEPLIFELFSKYVGKVEQRVQSVDAEFWFAIYGLRIIYATNS